MCRPGVRVCVGRRVVADIGEKPARTLEALGLGVTAQVCYAALPGVYLCGAEFCCRCVNAHGGLDQGRAGTEQGAVAVHDDDIGKHRGQGAVPGRHAEHQRNHRYAALNIRQQLQVAGRVWVALCLVAGTLSRAIEQQEQWAFCFQGQAHQPRALGGVGMPNRASLHGEVLNQQYNTATVQARYAPHQPVGRNSGLPLRVMAAGE